MAASREDDAVAGCRWIVEAALFHGQVQIETQ
jgi:hypothetical protein